MKFKKSIVLVAQLSILSLFSFSGCVGSSSEDVPFQKNTTESSTVTQNQVPVQAPVKDECLNTPSLSKTACDASYGHADGDGYNEGKYDLSKIPGCSGSNNSIRFQGKAILGDGTPLASQNIVFQVKLTAFGWYSVVVPGKLWRFTANGLYATETATDPDGNFEVVFSMMHARWLSPNKDIWKSVCMEQMSSIEASIQVQSKPFYCPLFCDGQGSYLADSKYKCSKNAENLEEYSALKKQLTDGCNSFCSARKWNLVSTKEFPLLSLSTVKNGCSDAFGKETLKDSVFGIVPSTYRVIDLVEPRTPEQWVEYQANIL